MNVDDLSPIFKGSVVPGQASKATGNPHSWFDLEAQNQVLRTCLDSLDSMVFSVDEQYRYLSFNRRHAAIMKAIYGVEIELGKSLLEYQTVAEDRARAKTNLDRALAGETVIEEAFSGDSNETRRYFEVTHHPIRDESGGSAGVVVIAMDVTLSRQALHARSESESRLRTIFEQASVGVVEVDPITGGFLQVNRRYCDIVGYSREELLRSDVQSLTHPEDLAASQALMVEVRTGRVQECALEKRFIHKDGHIVWVSIQVMRLIPGGALSPTNFSIVQDITARKLAEEQLRASEELHRSLFESMLNGFASCRMHYDERGRPQDFRYLDVNPAFEALTGLKNVIGKSVTEVIPGIREADPELFERYGRVALTGQPERFELYVAALGKWFSISVYSPSKKHFVAVFDVIDERKRAEAASKTQLEELRRWHEATLGREMRILDLKREVNALLLQLGHSPRYGSVSGNETRGSQEETTP